METVKKVKFPAASILFLFDGVARISLFAIFIVLVVLYSSLFLSVMTLSPEIKEAFSMLFEAFATGDNLNSESNDFLYIALSSFLFWILTGFINSASCIFLSVPLFKKKANGLLIGGFIALMIPPILKILNVIQIVIFKHDYIFNSKSEFFGSDVIYYLVYIVVTSLIYLSLLVISLLFVVFLIKIPEQNHLKKSAKLWFIPGILLLLYNVFSMLFKIVLMIMRYFNIYVSYADFSNNFLAVILPISLVAISNIPFIIAFFLLFKWLKNPYKIVSVPQPVQEYTAPSENNTEEVTVPAEEKLEEIKEEIIESVIKVPARQELVKQQVSTPAKKELSSVEKVSNDIYTLKKMYDDGVISDEEFSQKKKQLLDL